MPSTHSSFKGDKELAPLTTVVGRIFANKFNDLRNFNNPCSGRLLGSVHLGPPIAPSKIASALLHAFKVFSVKGSPNVSIEAPQIRGALFDN